MAMQSAEKCTGCAQYGSRSALIGQSCNGCEGMNPRQEKPAADVPAVAAQVQIFQRLSSLPEKHCGGCGIMNTEAEDCPICGEPLAHMPQRAPIS